MKKAIYILIFGACFAAMACKSGDPLPDIQTFEVSVPPSNALRAEVQVSFSEKTAYQVEYWPTGDETAKRTTEVYEGTASNTSARLILLLPDTEYACRILYGNEKSESKTFATRPLPAAIPRYEMQVDNLKDDLPGYILAYSRASPGGAVYLMDTRGRTVWYEAVSEGVLVANIDRKTNRIYMLTGLISEAYAYSGRYVKVMDLFGNLLMEKDLIAMPELADRQIHHECRPMPDGGVLLVSYVKRAFDLRAQGGGEQEMVYGDGYVILDARGNIAQMWDCYGHIDPRDDPNVMATKDSWLHANSANYDENGDIYMTFRSLSQLWKIDPKTGSVKYRVGKNGTVALPTSGIPDGPHCAVPYAPDEVLIFDNQRSGSGENRSSRALVYKTDEAGQTAEVALSCELPYAYSSRLMSNVQKVDGKMLMFGSGTAKLILFTDTSPKVNVLRAISAPQQFYRAEYIPSLRTCLRSFSEIQIPVQKLHKADLVTQYSSEIPN